MGQVSINGHCYNYVAYGGFCEYSKQCNYLGSICFQKRCVCPPGQLYNGKQCINDPNIPNGNYVFLLIDLEKLHMKKDKMKLSH
ncbi:unnamed protein product [Meloidogyne enterolobii]|uniref:Uncharacterized protein n=1 Tax=Meloidogyne enterolobii TaxID=390850 RepID=A0ACB0YC53_MELEN